MRRTLPSLLMAIVILALPSPARAQPALTFRFDNAPILDAPLQFHFERDAVALSPDGSLIPIDQPRYREPTLLAPHSAFTTDPDTFATPAVNILATGFAADGITPIWLIADFGQIRLRIYVGSMTSTPYEYSMAYNGNKAAQMDVLVESIDNVGNEAWRPVSAAICHGFIVMQCNVAVPGPAGWNSNRIGFLTCRISDLGGPKSHWWRRHAVSDPLSPQPSGVGLGAFWSLSSWWSTQRDGTAPTKAWIAATDYHAAPLKDGGAYMVFPIQRSSAGSGDWTASPVVELPGRWHDPTNTSHAHTIGITKFGTSGLLAIGSRGDSVGNAVNYAWTIPNESHYALGSTPNASAFNWRTAGPIWTGPAVVHGNLDPSLANLQTRMKGNQFVGIAPGPADGTFMVGGDEVSEPLWITSSPSSQASPLAFTAPYGIVQTAPLIAPGHDGPWRHYLIFHIHTPYPNALGGPYIAQMSPSQKDADGWANQRILYSPDGMRWAQVWTHYEGNQASPWLADNRIWVGSYGKYTGAGIRSIPVPDLVSASPLTIAPGGRNAAFANPAYFDNGLGVAIQANPSLPPSIPDPPCAGPWYRIENNPPTPLTGSYQLGRLRLAGGIPADVREVSVKFWVRHDTPDESGRADSLSIMSALRSSDAAGSAQTVRSSAASTSIDISTSGAWVPVVLITDLSVWAQPEDWTAAGGVLDLVLTSAWNIEGPASFYLAIESVSWEPSPPYPAAVETTLPDEQAWIDGFDGSGSWTVFVSGIVPPAAWDGSVSGPDSAEKPLFSIVSQTGQSWIDVLAERTQGAVVLRSGGIGAGDGMERMITFNWMAGSPIHLAVTRCDEWNGFIVRGTIGNAPIRSSFPIYATFDSPAGSVRFGSGDGTKVTALDVFGGAIAPGEATESDVRAVIQSLPMLRGQPMPGMTGDCSDMSVGDCHADFDGSGFIDTDDFDAFVQAFELGTDDADFDHSGFVDTDDFDGFVRAFIAGC
ncbi:MAG: hypothetical protein IT435_20435 [Phycisphaerales bacterium]|nr:hypothetical protein [Phycisphaerales bacterium]